MGDSSLSLDEQLNGELIHTERLRKIVLPPETFADAEEFLSVTGLNAFSFYPDLGGLALKHEQQVERDIRDAKEVLSGFRHLIGKLKFILGHLSTAPLGFPAAARCPRINFNLPIR